MWSRDLILKKGSEWLSQFDEIRFLGELSVDPIEIEEIRQSIGKYINAPDDDRFKAALAVIVVHIAYSSDEEISNTGFRDLVLNKLEYRLTLKDWNDTIGPSVLKILNKYFNEPIVPVSHKYVGPILRQSGVPTRLIKPFAKFFTELIKNYGRQFSKGQYDRQLKKSPPISKNLADFLKSQSGFDFCCDLARTLVNLTQNPTMLAKLQSLPGFPISLIQEIQKSPFHIPKSKVKISDPKLILNLERRRLAIEFSNEGLKTKSYRWANGGVIQHSPFLLNPEDLTKGFQVIVKNIGDSEASVKIQPWSPNISSFAVFNASNREYIPGTGTIQSRPYFFVVPEWVNFPSEYISEDWGYMDLGDNEGEWRIIKAHLPSGYQLEQIGLVVDQAQAAPLIQFQSNANALANTTNVFLKYPPIIEIVNHDDVFSRQFMIQHLVGDEWKIVPKNWFLTNNTIQIKVDPPYQGKIRIEPIGRTPKWFQKSELSFCVLPESVCLKWPTGIFQLTDKPVIELIPKEKFQADWLNPDIREIEKGGWAIPPNVVDVDGIIICKPSVTFFVSGTIYWFKINFSISDAPLVWRNQLFNRLLIEVVLSPNQSTQNFEFGVVSSGQFISLGQFGPVSKKGAFSLTSDSLLDTLNELNSVAFGQFAVRLNSTRILTSTVTFLNEGLLPEILCQEEKIDLHVLRSVLPGDLYEWINFSLCLRESGSQIRIPDSQPPTQLARFFRTLEYLHQVIDLKNASYQPPYPIPPDLQQILTWYLEVNELLTVQFTDVSEAVRKIQALPTLNQIHVPLARWQDAIDKLKEKVKSVGTPIELLSEWVILCREKSWRKAKKTRLGCLPGGSELTEVSEYYFWGLDHKATHKVQSSKQYLNLAKSKCQVIYDEVKKGLIWEIAKAFEVMIFFHCDHLEFRQLAQSALENLPETWSGFKFTLLRLLNPGTPRVNSGLYNLSSFSPHQIDVVLENHPGNDL